MTSGSADRGGTTEASTGPDSELATPASSASASAAGSASSEPEERWLPGDGIRVHALDWGPRTGTRPVLMLHGVGGNARIWSPVAERLLPELDGSHRLVAIDQRDGGLTDHPADGYDAESFAGDILKVHDALGGAPMILVGHSRGAWLAAWFAERYPERIAGLVLVDPARLSFMSDEDADTFYEWVRSALGPFPDRDAALAWAQSRDHGARWTPARIRSFFEGYEERGDGSLVGRLPPPAVDRLRAAREREDVVGPRLHEIVAPVLLLVGTTQSAARQADKRRYAEGLRNVRMVDIEATHFIHTDAPERVASLIGAFIAEIENRS